MVAGEAAVRIPANKGRLLAIDDGRAIKVVCALRARVVQPLQIVQ
jgi:hypothetical protein